MFDTHEARILLAREGAGADGLVDEAGHDAPSEIFDCNWQPLTTSASDGRLGLDLSTLSRVLCAPLPVEPAVGSYVEVRSKAGEDDGPFNRYQVSARVRRREYGTDLDHWDIPLKELDRNP